MSDFDRWIEELVAERYGTAGKLAKLINLTESGFSRGIKHGTLSTESLLRLAREVGSPPAEVLRLAGKAHIAELLAELYGEPPARQTPMEARVVRAWRALPKAAREHWLALAEAYAKGNNTANGTTRKKP